MTQPAERILLDRQAVRLHRAWRAFIRAQQAPDTIATMMPLFQRRDLKTIMAILDHSIRTLANTWDEAFAEVANVTASRIQGKLGKAAPKVSAVFEPGDPRAATLMARNRLEFITGLTTEQRDATRIALTRGLKQGWSTDRLAAAFRDSIGLTAAQQQAADTYRATLLRQLPGELDPATGTDIDLTPAKIERMVSTKTKTLLDTRAQTIARTEALRVSSTAQDIALRESLAGAGTDTRKVFKTWNTTRDGRERPEHAERDGVTIPLDDSFAPGIMKPGDGSAREAANCRCVLTFTFED